MSINHQFSIGPDSIEILVAGEPTRIDDESVQGISTRVSRATDWLESRQENRTVTIEIADAAGKLRNVCIEAPVPKAPLDELAEYAQRVAPSASRNTLNELVAQESVQRNGFTINDQGILLAASGQTLCCGLFDVTAIDFAGDRTILWTDGIEPAAVIREHDANAPTLKHLLPQLIRAVPSGGDQHLVGCLACETTHGANMQSYKVIVAIVGLVFGVIAAVCMRGLMNVRLVDASIILQIGIPVLLVAAALAWRHFRGVPQLAVFCRGICVRRGKQVCELSWDDMYSLHISYHQNNMGTFQNPHYVQHVTLKVRPKVPTVLGTAIVLTWPDNDSTKTCTEFLRAKCLMASDVPQNDASAEPALTA